MSFRHLLAAGLSAATGRLRLRSLSTAAASHPPWAMINRIALAYKSELPTFHLGEPPHYSYLMLPTDLIYTSDDVVHLVVGDHVVAVDMDVGKVTGSFPHPPDNMAGLGFIPCVLGSMRIPPSAGKDISTNQAYADVQVHSGRNDDDEYW